MLPLLLVLLSENGSEFALKRSVLPLCVSAFSLRAGEPRGAQEAVQRNLCCNITAIFIQ